MGCIFLMARARTASRAWRGPPRSQRTRCQAQRTGWPCGACGHPALVKYQGKDTAKQPQPLRKTRSTLPESVCPFVCGWLRLPANSGTLPRLPSPPHPLTFFQCLKVLMETASLRTNMSEACKLRSGQIPNGTSKHAIGINIRNLHETPTNTPKILCMHLV